MEVAKRVVLVYIAVEHAELDIVILAVYAKVVNMFPLSPFSIMF